METAKYKRYETKQGDRWDTIAYAAYNDATRLQELLAANPHIPLTGLLPVGVIVNIPILEQAIINENDLPPWRRLINQ